MPFFRQNNYEVALPAHQAFAPDRPSYGSQSLFESEVYLEEDFAKAIQVIQQDAAILRGALEWFSAVEPVDDLRHYGRYEVRLTLYGPGGSYDPETGVITLLTTRTGTFKGGGGVHTIVHEMMHLVLEELVQKFGLTHWEKERLVDFMVQRELGGLLPDAVLQPQGEAGLDPYLQSVPLEGLASALMRYTQSRDDGEPSSLTDSIEPDGP